MVNRIAPPEIQDNVVAFPAAFTSVEDTASAQRLTKELFEAADVPATRARKQVTQPPIILSNAHSPQEWERLIHTAWQKETGRILEVAKLVLQARDQLLPEVFKKLKLPFEMRMAQMLARIAANPVLNDPANHGSLPPCWRTLYELCKLSLAELKSAIKTGAVHPRMQRKDVDLLRGKQRKSPTITDNIGSERTPLLSPIELRRQLEIIGLAKFRTEVMPPDWRAPLFDTVLALASQDRLIEALEKKIPPSKTTRQALKNLRRNQP